MIVPIYPYGLTIAKQNDELKSYQESFNENIICALYIKSDSNINDVITTFGYDRTNIVIANSINLCRNREEISDRNKEWAKEIYIPENKVNGKNENEKFLLKLKPSSLNLIATEAREKYMNLHLWTANECNDKTHLNFLDRVMVLNPVRLKDEYKKPDEQLIYCMGGFGCSPDKVGNKIYGQFLVDGVPCVYNRQDFIGELKAEYLPSWAKEKLFEMSEGSRITNEISMT